MRVPPAQSWSRQPLTTTRPRIVLFCLEEAPLLSVLRTVGAAGLRAHLITAVPIGPARWCRYLDEVFTLERPEDLCETLRQLDLPPTEALLVPFDELGHAYVAAHRERLEALLAVTPVAPLPAFREGIDKGRLAQRLKALDLPRPPTWRPHEVSAIGPEDFPVIVKATNLCFGAGLEVCADREALEGCLAKRTRKGGDFIVQRLIEGYDIDCSVFCVEGRIEAWTMQREAVKGDLFSPASQIEFVHEPRVLEIVAKLMEALSWSGVAHVDLRHDTARDQFPVLEINGRFWGSLLGSTAAGVNFISAIVAQRAGAAPCGAVQRSMRFQSRGYGLRGFLAGRLRWDQTFLPFVLSDPLPNLRARGKSL